MIHTINGYTVIQDPENNHIMLFDSCGAVMHATCERPLNIGELQSVVRNYLNFIKRAVAGQSAEHCIHCGAVIPEGQLACKKCIKNPCNECAHEKDDGGYCLECYMGERWQRK